MAKLKGVGVFSLGKVMGMAGLLIGLFAAVFYGGILALFGAAGPQQNQATLFGLGGAFLVLLPLAYACMSFIGGLIHGIVINVVLGLSGGLEIELGE